MTASNGEMKQRIERAILASDPDEIIAGTLAGGGPLLGPVMLTGGACGALFYWLVPAGGAGLLGSIAFGALSAIVASAVGALTRRRVYVAVTRSQVVCYRVIRWRGRPWSVRESFRAPISAVHIGGSERKPRRNWSISFHAYKRGVKLGSTPELSVAPAWSAELDQVLRALQGAGAGLNRALSSHIGRPELAAETD